MATIVNAKFKQKRGTEASIPVLLEGELYVCTDSNKLYVGTSSGNQLISDISQLNDMANGSSVVTLLKDITLTGKQKITTPFKFKYINIQCVSNQFTHVYSNGYCDADLRQNCIFDNNCTIPGSFSQNSNGVITVKFPSGGVIYGNITKIEKDGITIEWSNNGLLTEIGTLFLLISGVI